VVQLAHEDQRFVTDRKDVAVWKLPVLKRTSPHRRSPRRHLRLHHRHDNDLVVKLIDQYPGDDPDPKMRGYQLMTNEEIFRGRYLEGFDKPTPLRSGSIHEYKFSLHDVDHVFKAGHTVMVEIQSTWFPLYDRNPQTFVPNIMTAKPEGLQARHHHHLLRPRPRLHFAGSADDSRRIELRALVVKPVRYLVTNYNPDRSIIHSV
jgi:predicted acyl esterase